MKKVAILVDGGFYRKVAKYHWGEKSPEQRCEELIQYCIFSIQKACRLNSTDYRR